MEFVYQGHVRWSLWFENPNHAGAFLVCLLPFAWGLMAWRRETSGCLWRGANLVLWTVHLGLWFLLLKTYSRGALIATLIALGYWLWVGRKKVCQRFMPLWVTFVAVLIMAVATKSGDRAVGWLAEQDGSVTNRLAVWKGGLQMLADAPLGVGQGNSGQVFTQWYQPLEMKTAYRTLVNSYLTFLTERGGVWSGLILAGAIFFWRVTGGKACYEPRDASFHTWREVMRASLLAFAVSGLFSTTFEVRSLWVLPALCALGLTLQRGCWTSGRRWRNQGWLSRSRGMPWNFGWNFGMTAAISVCILGLLFAAGCWLNRGDGVRREFLHGGTWIRLSAPNPPRGGRILFLVDSQVMGEHYGKLLRAWCQTRGADSPGDRQASPPVNQRTGIWTPVHGQRRMTEVPQEISTNNSEVILAGETVRHVASYGMDFTSSRVVLMMPAALDQEKDAKLFWAAKSLTIIAPGMDQDGRGAWWKRASSGASSEKVRLMEMEGCGVEVSWSWDTVMTQLTR